jgi:hypothetical protein
VAGSAFFALSQWLGGNAASAPPAAARQIDVNAARIHGMVRDYTLANHASVSEADIRALIRNFVDEEILFREAVASGFEQADRSIAYRLEQKMRFLGEDRGESDDELYRRALAMGLHLTDPIVRNILIEKIRLVVGRATPPPTDAELESWYQAHLGLYQQAGRISLRQVFFDRGRRGADGARDAAEKAAALAQGHGEEVASSLGGDPFVMGSSLDAQRRDDLTKYFGAAFADAALALPADAWSEPIASPYGWHVVFIRKRFDARTPELAEVRSRAETACQTERREQRVVAYLDKLRSQYTVRIDEDAVRREVGHGPDDIGRS